MDAQFEIQFLNELKLKVKIQQNSAESHRISDEISAKFEATIDHLKDENESLMTNQRPQIEALEVQNRTYSKENSKLRHQVQVRKNCKGFSMYYASMESSNN